MAFVETSDGFINESKIIRIVWMDRDNEKEWDIEYLAGSEIRIARVHCTFLNSLGFAVDDDGSVDYPRP